MEDKWQPEDVVDQLALELRENKEYWTMLLECFREADSNEVIANKLGRRPDLEPEYFPEARRPNSPEIAAEFLEKKYGRKFHILNSQLVFAAGRLSNSEGKF